MLGTGLGRTSVGARSRLGLPQAEPLTFWLDPKFDNRIRVSLTNTTGSDMQDQVVSVTVPSGIDASSLTVVEHSAIADQGIDLGTTWRYGTARTSSLNPSLTLPCYKVDATHVMFKVFGWWPVGQTRYFYVYWDSTGVYDAPTPNYLGGIAIAWSVAITAGTTGDVYRIVAGGVTHSYTMQGGDTAANIATALRTAITNGGVATPGGSSATVTVTAINANDITFDVSTATSTVPGNAVVTRPNAFGIGRVGPDAGSFTPASFSFGLPYNNGATILTTPAFNRISSNTGTTQGVRFGQYRVNGDGTTYKALTSVPTSLTRNGPNIGVGGSVTFSTRSGDVDWTATYTCDYRHRFGLRRPSSQVPFSIAITRGSDGDSYVVNIDGVAYTYVQQSSDTTSAILATSIKNLIVATATNVSAICLAGTTTIAIIPTNYEATTSSHTVTNTGSTVPSNIVVTAGTGKNTVVKYADVMHVVLTQTCNRAYTPANIANNVTGTSNFDFLTLASTNNNFISNVTEHENNKIPNFSAPVATGIITPFGASADLSGLPVVDTILGTHGNTNGWGIRVISATYSGFGSQTPEFKWAATSNPFAVLQFRNVSNGSQIPQGAQVVIDFWIVSGFTTSATTVADNLLPDEVVDILRRVTDVPTTVVTPVVQYSVAGDAEMFRKASDLAFQGLAYFRAHASEVTGVARGYPWRKQVNTGAVSVADDDDGSYSVAYALKACVLRYLRTGDTTYLRIAEDYVNYFIDIEAATIAAYGSFWSGAISYWYAPYDTGNTQTYTGTEGGIAEASGASDVDPNFGVALGSITYGTGSYPKGIPRRRTSIDQMHISTWGLWHYLYLLRHDPNVDSTVRTAGLALLSRMASFEALHYSTANRIIANCYQLCTDGSPVNFNGIQDTVRNTGVPTSVANPYYGDVFKLWQNDNGDGAQANASANQTTDENERALFAPDSVESGVLNYTKGKASDMLVLDIGQHDVTWGANLTGTGTLGVYPKGWSLRANVPSNTTEYESSRTSASNNGYSSDKHLINLNNGGARDHMSGRAAQRACVLAWYALLDPTGTIAVEMNGSTVLRSVVATAALNDQMRTIALYGTEPTTKAQRYAIAGYAGKTTTYDPEVVDHAATAYWAAACEMWLLLQDTLSGTRALRDYYRWEGTAAPEWRRTVPIGPYIDSNRMTTLTTDLITPMTTAAIAGGHNTVFMGNHSIHSHETTPHQFYPALRAASADLKIISQESGRWTTPDPPNSIGNGWFGTLTHAFDKATAAPFVQHGVDFWADKTHHLGQNFKDDATESSSNPNQTLQQTAQRSLPLIQAFQEEVPSKFATATCATVGSIGVITTDAQVLMAYKYPFGVQQASGGFAVGGPYIWTPKGQFRSSRNSNAPSHDYIDEITAFYVQRPKNKRLYVALQLHCTLNNGSGVQTATPTSATQLRYPYPEEVPLYVWLLIARGVNGFFWFTWNDEPAGGGGWYGYGNAAQSSLKTAVDTITARITSNNAIMEVLRRTEWDSAEQPFTVTGGGEPTNNYSNGICSMLKDPYTGARFVVIGSYGLTSTNMKVFSTLTGTLKSLETGTSYALGTDIPVGALDGTILRFIPS